MTRDLPRLSARLAALVLSTACRGPLDGERKISGAPTTQSAPGYAGSGACRSCHPGEHASYRETYHATMTRLPSEVAFDGESGPRLPLELEDEFRLYRLEISEGVVSVEGPDLHFVAAAFEKARGREAENAAKIFSAAPKVKRPIALVTGSHHYLALWVSGGENKELRQLPFVWLKDEKRFIPRASAFLAKPSETFQVPNWNASCIQCHTTAFEPHESEGREPSPWVRYASTVTDLSIACEACHGPGKVHADHYRSPFVRANAKLAKKEPYEILAPHHLDASASSAVCGQCHSYFVPRDSDAWWTSGFSTSPPAHLDFPASRELLVADRPERARELGLSRDLESIFWSDGSVRVGGREYHGLLRSACHTKGKEPVRLSCVSCHEMHGGTKSDALPEDSTLEATCRSCHGESLSKKWHTEHQGKAECADCHMPKTSYALLGTVMSHEITIPRASLDPPSACIYCHLEQNEAWLTRALGSDPARGSLATTGFAARFALAGDAALRAIVADWLGHPGVRKSVRESLREDLLDELSRDEYPAVREIARRSGARPGPRRSKNEDFSALRTSRDERPVVISE